MPHVEAFECYGARVVNAAISKYRLDEKTNATIIVLDSGRLSIGCASLVRPEVTDRGSKWICGIVKNSSGQEVVCPHLYPII